MSVRIRLTISIGVVFGTVVIALATGAYVLLENYAYLRLDSELQVAIGSITMSAEHEMGEHSTRLGGERDLQLVLDEASTAALATTNILVRDGDRNVAYKIAASQTVMTQLQEIRRSLFILVCLGLGVAGLAGYFVAKRSLRPLQDFAKILDAVTSADLSARVTLSTDADEIGRLGMRFNCLLSRLEDAFQLQRRFMADASHQLRTPVTVALVAAQVTGRDANASVIDCKDSLQMIVPQMLQLRRTIEDMFFLSQADVTALKLGLRDIYLDDAVSDAVLTAKALSAEKRQSLSVGALPEAPCRGDVDLLKQAILILLDNAVKFTPAGGSISVALHKREDSWVCSVTDNGLGISQSAQPQIFDRFFRERLSGKEGVPGSGLGLAIAKVIAESHGGTLTLVESRTGRTHFELAIPVLLLELRPEDHHGRSLALNM